MGTLLHLDERQTKEFVAQLKSHALREYSGGNATRRYNVLDRNLAENEISTLHPDILPFLRPGTQQFDPVKELWVTVSYGAISALASFFIEGRQPWSLKDIKRFNDSFFEVLYSIIETTPALHPYFPSPPPEKAISRTGLCFRLCTLPWSNNEDIYGEEIEELIRTTVHRFRDNTAHEVQTVPSPDRTVSILRSIVPIPHNEIYKNYKKTVNPIGFYQAVFMEAKDLDCLRRDKGSVENEAYWRLVGRIIAGKLMFEPVPGILGRSNCSEGE